MGRPAKKEETLVPVSFIQALTGWKKGDLQRARESMLVEQRKFKDKNGKPRIRYVLESLKPQFIQNQKLLQ